MQSLTEGQGMIIRLPGHSKHRKKLIIGLIVTTAAILIVISSASIAFGLSIRSYRISGISMEPGLHNGQVVYISSLFYKFSRPSRGDLVIFHQPFSTTNPCQFLSSPDMIVIKRIIGIPGDTVSVTSTSVLLNGSILNEPYVASDSNGVRQNGIAMPSITLGPDQYFLMGDSRLYSADSRCYGPVPFNDFIGRVIIII
jgi:signal peptidase I